MVIKKRSVGSGRVAEYSELENVIYDWIIHRRFLKYVV